MQEIWLPIPNYENLYKISNFGTVKSLEKVVKCGMKNGGTRVLKERKMNTFKSPLGKNAISLIKNNKYKSFRIDYLLLITFKRLPEWFEIPHHINNNLSDDRLENLEWKSKLKIDLQTVIDLYKEGKPSTEIARITETNETLVCNYLRKSKTELRDTTDRGLSFKINYNFFDKINTEEKAYWLGFIYADGCVCKDTFSMSLSKVDESHLEKLKNCLSPERKLKEYISKYSPTPLTFISIKNKKLTAQLRELGVVDRKTFKIEGIPNIPIDLKRHFIRGYFDGDGSIFTIKKGNYIGYTMSILGNLSILEEIEDTFIKNCIDITKVKIGLCKRKVNNITCQYTKGGNPQTYRILEYLYRDSTIYLERKYDKFKQLEIKIQNGKNK